MRRCWPKGFLEGDGLRRDHMHQGSALYSWEEEFVDRFGMLSFAHHDATSGSTQGLVGSRGDKIGIGNRIRMEPCGNQPGDVGDIDQQIGPNRLGDLLESWKIEGARIGAGADDEQAWAAFLRHLLYRVIVDDFSLTFYAVGKHTEQNP